MYYIQLSIIHANWGDRKHEGMKTRMIILIIKKRHPSYCFDYPLSFNQSSKRSIIEWAELALLSFGNSEGDVSKHSTGDSDSSRGIYGQ